MLSQRLRWWGMSLSLAFYALSLKEDIFFLTSKALPHLPPDHFTGLSGLIHGIWLIFDLRPIWWANPLWAWALLALFQQRFKTAFWVSFLAGALGLTAFELLGQPVALGPGGSGLQIVSFGPGYALWLVALLMPAITVLITRVLLPALNQVKHPVKGPSS